MAARIYDIAVEETLEHVRAALHRLPADRRANSCAYVKGAATFCVTIEKLAADVAAATAAVEELKGARAELKARPPAPVIRFRRRKGAAGTSAQRAPDGGV